MLESANALSESQREQINTLQSSLDGLRVDYDNAQAEIAYMTEQIEVMREEYQKKIDQLIAENGNNNNTDTPPTDEEPIETDENGMKLEQIIGLSAGLVVLVVIVMLLIPKRRRRQWKKQCKIEFMGLSSLLFCS